jgi:hypothetical protein
MSSKIYNGLSPKISQAKALARFSPFCYAAQYYVGMFTVAYDYMSGSSNSRRQFIVHAGVWFAGAALARPFSALAATNSNLPGEPVWTVLSHYGGSVQIFGGSVIGFLGGKDEDGIKNPRADALNWVRICDEWRLLKCKTT